VLIYIKATLGGDESSDVKEYADRQSKFPHESTGDQFFNENQFESYRELGRHIGLKVFAPLFSPKLDTPKKKLSAEAMTPQQIRDALPERLRDHPELQARQSGRGQKPGHPKMDEPARKTWLKATASAFTFRLGKLIERQAVER